MIDYEKLSRKNIQQLIGDDTEPAINTADKRKSKVPLVREYVKYYTQGLLTPIEQLKQNGFVHLGSLMSQMDASNIRNYLFDNQFVYHAHIPVYANDMKTFVRNEQDILQMPNGTYSFTGDVILKHPLIQNLIINPSICNLAQSYLGAAPTFYDCNAICNVYNGQNQNIDASQQIHRDKEDFKSLTMLVYLNDTDIHTGSHLYQVGSHLKDDPEGDFVALTGKAGTAFFEDGFGQHFGKPLDQAGYRIILWFRYGYYANAMYEDTNKLWQYKIDKSEFEKHIPMNDFNNYLLRLFIK